MFSALFYYLICDICKEDNGLTIQKFTVSKLQLSKTSRLIQREVFLYIHTLYWHSTIFVYLMMVPKTTDSKIQQIEHNYQRPDGDVEE